VRSDRSRSRGVVLQGFAPTLPVAGFHRWRRGHETKGRTNDATAWTAKAVPVIGVRRLTAGARLNEPLNDPGQGPEGAAGLTGSRVLGMKNPICCGEGALRNLRTVRGNERV
jgi:hypothetical protein